MASLRCRGGAGGRPWSPQHPRAMAPEGPAAHGHRTAQPLPCSTWGHRANAAPGVPPQKMPGHGQPHGAEGHSPCEAPEASAPSQPDSLAPQEGNWRRKKKGQRTEGSAWCLALGLSTPHPSGTLATLHAAWPGFGVPGRGHGRASGAVGDAPQPLHPHRRPPGWEKRLISSSAEKGSKTRSPSLTARASPPLGFSAGGAEQPPLRAPLPLPAWPSPAAQHLNLTKANQSAPHGLCTVRPAPHATCTTHGAPCTLHHKPCTARRARQHHTPRSPRCAPCRAPRTPPCAPGAAHPTPHHRHPTPGIPHWASHVVPAGSRGCGQHVAAHAHGPGGVSIQDRRTRPG